MRGTWEDVGGSRARGRDVGRERTAWSGMRASPAFSNSLSLSALGVAGFAARAARLVIPEKRAEEESVQVTEGEPPPAKRLRSGPEGSQ